MKRPVGIIAFDRHSSLDQGLVFMMNADGSNAHQLAAGWHLDFRPDGTRVAFEETKSIGNRVIYEVDLTGLVVDLSTSPYDYSDSAPRWSPDGTKLAFERDAWQGDNFVRADLYVADFGTSPPTSPPASLPILKGPFGVPGAIWNWPGDWSPDGTCIAFCSYSASAPMSTYIMNADGTGVHRVCAGGPMAHPCWSPDGKFLAFGDAGIYRILVEGTGFIQLTKGFPKSDSYPDW